ncbi:hypothetical protein ACFLXM_02175 [Chloroflexota bacterium]
MNALEEGKAEIDWGKVFKQECHDEKYSLRMQADLSPSENALAYKGL